MASKVMGGLKAAFADNDVTISDKLMQLCADICVHEHVDPVDVAAQLDAAVLNANADSVSSSMIDKLRSDLAKGRATEASRPSKRDLVRPAGRRVEMYNASSKAKMPGFAGAGGDSSFEATFNVKLDPVASRKQSPMAAIKRHAAGADMASPPSAKVRRREALPPSATRGGDPVVMTYNRDLLAGGEASKLSALGGAQIKSLPPALDTNVTSDYRFMFTSLEQRAEALEQHLLAMEGHISKARSRTEATPVGEASQDPVLCYGRVCCDSEGKINHSSVLLEGSRRSSNGARVPVDLSERNAYTLFPGQVIAVHGINSTGTRLVAKDICEGVPAPMLRSSPEEIRALASSSGTTRVWTAAGPFSHHGDLKYRALETFLAEAQGADQPPDVIVLMGPFVDQSHPQCMKGEVYEETEDGIYPMSYDELFGQQVEALICRYMAVEELQNTKVVIVPAVTDAHLHPVFPQPPMRFSLDFLGDAKASVEKRLVMVSNPGTFTINGMVFSVNTNDVLRHIVSDVAARHPPPAPNMFERLCRAMILQRSHYPLFPPPKGAFVELSRLRQLGMSVTPDVMLVSSALSGFARQVEGVLCVNPGRLTKAKSNGTFAKLVIHPMSDKLIDAAAEKMAVAHKPGLEGAALDDAKAAVKKIPHLVADRAGVEVIRLEA